MRKSEREIYRSIYFLSVIVLATFSVAFFLSYVKKTETLFIKKYSGVVSCSFIIVVVFFTCVNLILKTRNNFYARLIFISLIFLFFISVLLYSFTEFGLWDKIDGVENLRAFISSFNGYSEMLYVLLQFLQVAVIPIPSFITIGAGVLLFGPLKAAILSIFGIIFGSLFAFFVGKYFGTKAIRWLIGGKNLEKGLNFLEGKDEIVLTFMFLFPLFPDDILCFAAGLTKVNPVFFVIMIVVVKIITVFTSCYSINNSIIPYDTPWGIALWIAFFLFMTGMAFIIHKKGKEIEKNVKNFFTSAKCRKSGKK